MAETGTMTIYVGVTYEATYVYKADGVVVNLTGKTVVFHLLNNKNAEVLTLSSADGANALGSIVEITSAVGGAFRLKLTDEQTATMDAMVTRWWFGLEGSGDEKLIGRAPVSVINP